MEKITCIVVDAERKPKVVQIEKSLESYQKVVGGYIEVVYPFDDNVGIVCNEDGIGMGLPLNRALHVEGELRDKGEVYDVIKGKFLIVGLTEEDFGDLTEEQQDKYLKRFEFAEIFFYINKQLHVCKTKSDIDSEP